MDLILEVFPKYNPLPDLIGAFRVLESTKEIQDHEIVCEIIEQIFSEAGVIVDTPQELVTIIGLLVEHNVLQFVTDKGEPYLVTNPQYHEEI